MNSRKAIVEGLIFMAGEEGLSLLQQIGRAHV